MSNETGEKKFVVITGGSGGIGAAIADIFCPENAIILQYYKSIGEAKKIELKVKQKKGTIFLIQADLTTESGCRNFYNEVSKITNKIDILVNNIGGVVKRHTLKEIDWDLIQQYFQLNTFSTIMISSLFISLLENGENPSIINITSGSIRLGSPNNTLYAAAKGAVDVFTRGMANELAPRIRVNSIAPGVIDTKFHKDTPEHLLEKLKVVTPLNRLGVPGEVAHSVLFLAQNSFITGETIDINGGLSMR